MNRSILIALIMAGAVTAWMLTGKQSTVVAKTEELKTEQKQPKILSQVKVKAFKAKLVVQEIVINGRTAPSRKVTIQADTRGKVRAIVKKRGANVKRGEAMLYFNIDDRNEQLRQAQALVEQRKIEFEASQSLKDKGLRAESQMAEATTQLRAAEAGLKSIELDVNKTTVRAPFDGVVDQRMVEQGSYLSIGDPIATIVDIDPYLIVGDMAEGEAIKVQLNQKVHAKTADGRMIEGRVRYISTEADPQSRTFYFEVEVSNPDNDRMLGITTEIILPVAEVMAHKLTPALFSLNDEGVIGIKGVNSDNMVEFFPITIARSDSDGVWVSGLPESINIITVGQGFVRAGEQVNVVMDK